MAPSPPSVGHVLPPVGLGGRQRPQLVERPERPREDLPAAGAVLAHATRRRAVPLILPPGSNVMPHPAQVAGSILGASEKRYNVRCVDFELRSVSTGMAQRVAALSSRFLAARQPGW